ncbi:MAG: signal recognition particle-docking protein FtsY [Hyphomonadaceae bacterium]
MIWGFGKKPPPVEEAAGGRRLFDGLRKSAARLTESVAALGKRKLDAEALEELEEGLIRTDMGARAAARIVEGFAEERFGKEADSSEIKAALSERIETLMRPREAPLDLHEGPKPRIVLMVGVNGSGKTTTVGKLCALLAESGAKVVVGAADTFRAAAIEQLKVWADRSGAAIVAREQGADAASVAFEAAETARRAGADVCLIDTAGRLQNREELMSELNKIVRALQKFDPDAPHETILVLDATVGQNALSQMEAFRSAAPLTGLVMTKLDGTAKGGVLVAIAERHALPIHFIGVGESAEDLRPFSARGYARALVGLE